MSVRIVSNNLLYPISNYHRLVTHKVIAKGYIKKFLDFTVRLFALLFAPISYAVMLIPALFGALLLLCRKKIEVKGKENKPLLPGRALSGYLSAGISSDFKLNLPLNKLPGKGSEVVCDLYLEIGKPKKDLDPIRFQTMVFYTIQSTTKEAIEKELLDWVKKNVAKALSTHHKDRKELSYLLFKLTGFRHSIICKATDQGQQILVSKNTDPAPMPVSAFDLIKAQETSRKETRKRFSCCCCCIFRVLR